MNARIQTLVIRCSLPWWLALAGLLLLGGQAQAQTYLISNYNNLTVTGTSGTFYDSGGASGSYADNEDYRVTFTSGSSSKLRFTFTSFSTEADYDSLSIYDGSSTAAPLLGVYDGTGSPGTITASGSSLTFVFVSDVSTTGSGWAATISTVASSATNDYGDFSSFGTASARANSTLRLGATATDAESASPANSIASGDDATGDDEDLTLPSFVAGQTATLTVPVYNNSGANAYLSAWIDYNKNGLLTDSGEQVVASQTVSTSSSIQTKTYSISVPSSAVTGSALGMRLRLNSAANVSSTGTGGNGEVEDYLITINAQGSTSFAILAVNYNNNTITRYNGSDGAWMATWTPSGLSSPNYLYRLSNNTLLVANGAADTITRYDAITGASLGTLVNNSLINFPYQMAISPDGNICLANQNGDNILKFNQSTGAIMATLASLSKPAGLVFGDDGLMYVTQNISGGTLRIYDEGGALQRTVATYAANEYPRGLAWGPDGRLYVNVRDNNASTGRVDAYTFPAGTKTVFVTMDSGSNPYTGIKWGPDGNLYVVDYSENQIQVYNATGGSVRTISSNLNGPHAIAFTDLTTSSSDFGDMSAFGTASSIRNGNLRLGNEVDTEAQARATTTANGDDIDDIDDEDGVTLPESTMRNTSGTATVKVTNLSGAAAYLNAWIDYNNNGLMTDSGEQIATNINIANGTNNGTQTINFTVPSSATIGKVGARFRLSSTQTPSSVGASGTGEVEDYHFTITTFTTDFGDYASFGSAGSTINNLLRLGSTSDAEETATTNTAASGDDTTGSDDEDGATVPGLMVQGQSATISAVVTNTTGATAYLNAWVDFNGNGVLTDAGEQVAVNTSISNGTTNSSRTISFTVPAAAVKTTVGVRLRLTSTTSPGPTGTSGVGEVEDYVTKITDWPVTTLCGSTLDSYTVLVTGAGKLFDMSGTGTTIYGNAAAADGVVFGVNGGALIGGTLYYDSPKSGTVSNLGNGSSGSAPEAARDLSQPEADAIAISTALASITPAQTFGTISSDFTINASAMNGRNVIQVANIDLASSEVLTINAGTLGFVVLNVSGSMKFTGQSNFRFTGGLDGTRLIINMMPGSGALDLTGTSQAYNATFLAVQPTNKTTVSGGAVITGTIITEDFKINGGGQVRNKRALACEPFSDFGDHSGLADASSEATTTFYMGSQPDPEADSEATAQADGDDITGIDDEDGVTLPASMPQGAARSVTVRVTNTSGSTAYLNVWIDFNRNGVLTDAGEQIATGLAIASGTANADQVLNFTVPNAASPGSAALRARLTTTSAPGPTGASGQGEVEDYVATIAAATTDFGDHASFAAASSTQNNGLRLGALTDTEAAAITNATATGDDTSGVDDEDGVSVPGSMTRGAGAVVSATVTNSTGTGTFLNAWVDFNRNGVLTDAGEQIAVNTNVSNGANNAVLPVSFTVPAGASLGTTGVRVRLTSTSSPGSTGASGNGEVEDYSTLICPVLSISPTSVANGTVGTSYNQATAFSASGGTAPYTFTASNLPPGITFDAVNKKLIGTPTSAGTTNVTIMVTDASGCPGAIIVPFTRTCPTVNVSPNVLAFATVGSSYSQATAFSATGGSGTYAFSASGLPTGMSFDAANKKLTGTPTSAGLSNVTVNATDANACAGSVAISLRICPQITISPTTLSPGVMTIAYNQATAFSASGGTAPYAWSVTGLPAGLSWNNSQLKITGTPTVAGSSTVTIVVTDANGCPGTISIPLQINNKVTLSNLVWGDLNNNGIKDTGENGINGVSLVLRYDANGDGDFVDSGEASYATTTTSGGGLYEFTGLPTGNFRVVIPSPPDVYPWSSLSVDLEDNQQDNDNNGYQKPTGGPIVSPIINLGTGELDSTVDFGLVPPNCENENMVMYLADLELDIVHKFKATGDVGVEVPGAWGGIPWLRKESTDSANGITNPHGAWFNGQDIYIGGLRGGAHGTFRLNQQGVLQAKAVSTYRLTHVTMGNYIYYPRDTYVSINDLTTGSELGRVNLTSSVSTTWGITVGNDGFLYVNDNYQSSTFPNGSARKDSGHIYRIDPKPSTFTNPATKSYSPIISGLDDMTGLDTDWSGNIYVVEIHIFDSPTVYGASTVKKYSAQGTLLATYNEPTPLDNVGVEDAWGMRWNPLDNKLYIATRSGDCVARLRADTMTYDGAFVPYVPNSYGKTLSLQMECATLDMGDLPDTSTSTGTGNYQTLQENGGPTHVINSTLRLGNTIDAEHAAAPSSAGNGDDLDGSDDEDAVSTWPTFVRNTTQTVAVKCYNTSGTAAKLYAYFDWNRDGDFGDSGESLTANVPNGTNGNINLSVPVPSAVVMNYDLGARFRLSTSTTLLSTGSAPNGEVEDYIIQAVACPTMSIAPTTLPMATINQAYNQPTAFSASGGAGTYTYTATTVPTGMTFNTSTLKVTGTPTATGLFNMSVRATDSNACQGTVVVPFRVCPVLSIAPISIGNGIVGTAYSQTLTASGGATPYAWTASGSVPPGLSISTSGVLSGTPTSAVSSQVFTVTATDSNGCSVSRNYTMSVNCPVLGITPNTTQLTEGLVGSSYTTSLSANGGSSPYLFTLAGGTTLPSGLNISSSGVITGTPSAGTTGLTGKSFTAQVTDQYGCTTTRSYNLKVCPVVTITGSPPLGTANVPYSTTFTAVGGVAPYTWSLTSGTLPPGLSLNSTSGVVSGTPTDIGSENITLTAIDANGCPGSSPFTIAIGCPAITVSPGSLPTGQVGSAFSVSFAAAGGALPYTWTLSSGSLPAGLTLASNGVLSGTPTAATAGVNGISITVRATDADLCATTKTYNLKIAPVITISPTTLPNATVGVIYSRTISAAGGTSPYAWSVITGTQPSGLSLNASTGILSGTPTVAGLSNFTVQALDTYQNPGTRAYSLRVCAVLGVGAPTMPVGIVGTPYMQGTGFTASGGTSPYTYTATGLPPGMSFDATNRKLTGTPSSIGTASVTINVADANGCTGSRVVSVTVVPVPPCFFVVCARQSGSLPRYSAVNGSYYNDMAPPGALDQNFDMDYGPDGHIYVAEGGDDDVVKYHRTTGAFLGVFVSAGAGGLDDPRALTFGPDGHLYVASSSTGDIYKYDGSTGAFMQKFVATGSASNGGPTNISQGLVFGPDGHLYVADSGTSSILKFNGSTGEFMSVLSSSTQGLSNRIRELLFGPDGMLYLSDSLYGASDTPVILKVNPSTGALSIFGSYPAGSTSSKGTTLAGSRFPTGLTVGLDNLLYVADATNSLVSRFNLETGEFIDDFAVSYDFSQGDNFRKVLFHPYDPSGCYFTYSIGNRVFNDNGTGGGIAGNGIQDGNETGVAGVVLRLLDSAGNAVSGIADQTTDADGYYRFDNVEPGYYRVQVLPSNFAVGAALTGWTNSAGHVNAGLNFTDRRDNGVDPGSAASTGVLTTLLYIGPGQVANEPDVSGAAAGAHAAVGDENDNLTVDFGFKPPQSDYGDYANFSIGGSLVDPALKMGAQVDIDALSISNASASSDDTTGIDDEDGVTMPSVMTVGSSVTIPVSVTNTTAAAANLNVWIDFNNNGSLTDVGEQVAANIAVSQGANGLAQAVNVSVPAGATTGIVGARFRLSSSGITESIGSSGYGEVEDYLVRLCPIISITPGALPAGTAYNAYSQGTAFLASGGEAPYIYSLVGTLPPGVSFNASSRMIVGTPSIPGTFTFTITAVDANGCPGSTTYNWVVNCPALAITPANLAGGTVNAAYSQTLAASGGSAPFTWSVALGTLPSGLTLAPGGLLSGVPAAAGSFTFTVEARDVNGCSSTRAYSINVVSLKAGNTVWSDLNNNGLKEAGEPGLSGVLLQLWNAGPNGIEENGGGDDVKVGGDAVSNSSGVYSIKDIPPAAGYYIRIPAPPPANALTGGVPVALDNGVDNDNNGLQSGGPANPIRSPLFAIGTGTEPDTNIDGDDTNGDQTIDFGLAQTVCVGNLVFRDLNNNGTYESTSDQPAAGVTLNLFTQGADPLSSTPVATTVSDADGLYLFSVRPGAFFIYVAADQFSASGPLYACKPTRGRSDSNVPNIDDNADQNALATSKPIATGVRTGNFSLAFGGQATALTGETGYLSASDNPYDSEANLTVDLGFYPLTGGSAPLAGRVQRDLSSSPAPLPGVDMALYEDTNDNGTLDVSEMSAVQTSITDEAGAYQFASVTPGQYLVVQTVLPGAQATYDSDGGDANVTAVTMKGEQIDGVDFRQATTEDTFAQWQARHHLQGSNEAHDNPDGDWQDNLLEYAFGTSPSSGATHEPFYLIASSVDGRVSGILKRPLEGHRDVSCALQLGSDPQHLADADLSSEVKANQDGTETVTFALPDGVDNQTTFVRLRVSLDADLDGSPEAVSTTPIYAYSQRVWQAGTQTLGMPLIKKASYVGAADGFDANDNISRGARYAEILSGARAGERLDVSSLSALGGEHIAVLEHWSVDDLFPPTRMYAGRSSGQADRLMFYAQNGYRVLWLFAAPEGPRWVREGDATLANAGNSPLPPGEGLLVNIRSGSVRLPLLGQLRSWDFSQSLQAGSQLVAQGWPSLSSPRQRGLASVFAQGSRIQVWKGDVSPSSSGYTSYGLNGGIWNSESGTSADDIQLFEPFRSVFITVPAAVPAWKQKAP